MKRFLLLSAIIIFSSAIPFRQLHIKYGPWISDITETGFTVNWITDYEALAYVETAPDDGTEFESAERTKHYQTIMGRRHTGKEHHVMVTGLEPGKTYRYRIGVTEVLDDTDPYSTLYGHSKTHRAVGGVRTSDNGRTEFRIAMFNDIHCNDERFRNLAKGLDPKDLDLIILNGDIASHMASADSLIKHVYQPITHLSSKVPSIYARGNHEGRGREFHRFEDFFPTSTGETYFSFRMGNTAFLVLDGGEDKPDNSPEYSQTAAYDRFRAEELAWLKEEVKKPEIASAPVKIAVMHIPSVKFQDSWYSEIWLAENFNPVLNEAGVDLMVSGHHHKYSFVEKGHSGNDFPILINSNKERLDILIDGEDIQLQTVNESGNIINTVSISGKN